MWTSNPWIQQICVTDNKNTTRFGPLGSKWTPENGSGVKWTSLILSVMNTYLHQKSYILILAKWNPKLRGIKASSPRAWNKMHGMLKNNAKVSQGDFYRKGCTIGSIPWPVCAKCPLDLIMILCSSPSELHEIMIKSRDTSHTRAAV